MIDEQQRHRRKVLGWTLILLALLMLVPVVFGRVLFEQMMLGTMNNSYALVTGLVLIFLALAGTGGYLLHTVRGR